MQKNYIIVGVFIALIVAGGMMALVSVLTQQALAPAEPGLEPGPAGEVAPPQEVAKSAVAFLSAQNNSGQDGIAFLTETNEGSARVDLSVSNFPSGVEQPAHIHLGSCANLGTVLYPLANVKEGISETVLDVSLDEVLARVPLAVNVHKSVTEVGVYVSCGDIQTP